MPGGPQPIDHQQRMENAHHIADQFQAHFGDQILAMGFYGSLAREMDGPYSDIEMHCVLKGTGIEDSVEWSAGPWKAEVDLYSRDVLLERAMELDESWCYTHGSYVHVLPLYDPEAVFPIVRQAVLSHPKEAFRKLIQEMIVGDIYEVIGKVRNAMFFNQWDNLAHYADQLAVYGACMIGLDHQHLYTGFGRMFAESLQLPNRPSGYDALCKIVVQGTLSDPNEIAQAVDHFWAGIEGWAAARHLVIEHQLSDLLKLRKVRQK